jgi:hypothetical protein
VDESPESVHLEPDCTPDCTVVNVQATYLVPALNQALWLCALTVRPCDKAMGEVRLC